MLRRSQRYNVKKPVPVRKLFRSVLRIESCETRDLAVDYDEQIQKQIASFRDIN